MPASYQLSLFPFEKRCTKCKRLRPITDFANHNRKAHARPDCKECRSIVTQAYTATHKEQIAEYSRRHHERHKEERHAREKYHRERRKAEISAYAKQWREEHKEHLKKKNRRYYLSKQRDERRANRPKWNAINHAWRKRNPEVSRRHQASVLHKRRARQRAASGHFTAADIVALELAQAGLCAYCGEPYERYHIEHKQPLSRGGSNWPANLCLACADCNWRKGQKTEAEFRALLIVKQPS